MKPRVSSRFLEGLLYALTAFGILAFGSVEYWSRSLLEILAFLLALSCFLRGRQAVSPMASAFWLFPTFFAALGALQLQTLAAPDGPRPWLPFTSAPHATETEVVLWAAYAAILWSVPRIMTTHEAARRYTRFLFGLGLFLALWGILQKATAGHKLYWIRETAGAGDFGPYYDRDHAANFLLMTMSLGIGILFSRIRREPGANGPLIENIRSQGLIAGGVLFLLLGILATGSRGAVLAMPLTGAALTIFGADFAQGARRRRLRIATAMAGAAAAVFLAYRFVIAPAEAGTLVDISVMGRLSIYADACRWLRDTPLFGTGLGSFETVYPSYQDGSLREIIFHAHSDWLETALESGILGVLTTLTAASLAAFAAVRAWHAARSTEMRALIGGGLAAATAFSLHSLFEFNFQIPANAVVVLGIVGFLLSAPAWADKSGGRPRSQPPPVSSSLAATACFVILTLAALRPAVATWLAKAPGDLDERTAAVTRGLSYDWDPYYLKGLASISYERAGRGTGSDINALRAALAYSLATIELRPFDADALYFAGASLWRLERPADARVLLDEAQTVRFTPIDRIRTDEDYEHAQDKLRTLRSLGLFPPKAASP